MSKKIMKKALKVGLALLVAGSFATAAYAEGKITGRAVGHFQMKSGDGGAVNEMGAGGRLGFTASTEAGGWTATGYTEIDSDTMSFYARDTYVALSNDSMMYRLGRVWLGGSTLGGAYVGAELDNSLDVGDTGRDLHSFTIALKQIGVAIVVATNEVTGTYPDEAAYGPLADTAYAYNQQVLAARYTGMAADLKYTVAFSSIAGTVDEDRPDHLEGGAGDGAAAAKIQLGVKYSMGDMTPHFAYASTSSTLNSDDDTTETYTEMGLGFDMAFGDGGLSLQYATETTNSGATDAVDAVDTRIFAVYKLPIGPLPLYLSYYSLTSDNGESGDANVKTTDSVMGVEMVYGF